MKNLILSVLMLCAGAARASDYSVADAGDFAPAGRRVEFADRFGWQSYKVKFDFGFDGTGRSLASDSRLEVSITLRDGRVWNYSCRARGKNALSANVNYLNGAGLSVVAECRVDEGAFADAVGLHKDDVGAPNLVFQALVQDGTVRAGSQRGLYFAPSAQIESSDLNAYASRDDDPSSLTVTFRSN